MFRAPRHLWTVDLVSQLPDLHVVASVLILQVISEVLSLPTHKRSKAKQSVPIIQQDITKTYLHPPPKIPIKL